ncbi:MAG TPA: excinuclease ABC subunit UvrC [Candidatus Saccharimonadales bacterium]|nr:excinuclease ABC subunit UvrC [Candidatus Saccharimonadales bacterium]
MTDKLQQKLKSLPLSAGVYFHKNAKGQIIYVGKAAVLKNRVRQYFQKTRDQDAKTKVLVSEIADTDWITTESEIDALFLESEMVKRYKPRYNILLQDDKSQLFVRINMRDAYPFISFTRQPMDDGAEYFGPYYNGFAVKKALRFLRKVFPYSTHATMPKRLCLQYHLGLCPGVEEQKISSTDYKKTLRSLILYLKGERVKLVNQLESEMNVAAKHHNFELAATRRNQIYNLKELQKQILFSDREFMDISKDQALAGLDQILSLKGAPHRIEGYDISHMSGTNNVASMVVATNGLADKAEYRKFKMRLPGNNDFAHMHETISRRFSGRHLDWPKPDLILIDGGKGQLASAIQALQERGIQIPVIGLAKRLEEIVISKNGSNVTLDLQNYPDAFLSEFEDFYVVLLPKDSHIIKLLQRLRDESHRFAVSYHTVLKRAKQTESEVDSIPGIGPATRKKLILSFGSLRAAKQASKQKLVAVLGKSKAEIFYKYVAGDIANANKT